MNLPPNRPTDDCSLYWEEADWLPPWYILDHWCHQDARCKQAKYQALLSACERGEVAYRRSDRKTFDDPVDELAARGILMIGRTSFDAWASRVEGKSPLPSPKRPDPITPRPAWADESWSPQPAAQTAKAWSPTPATLDVDSTPTAEDSEADEDDPPVADTGRAIPSVSSHEIVDAFRVKDDPAENRAWWDERLRDAKRYKVIEARTARGRLQTPSYWRPDLVAVWLIDGGHLPAKAVKRILLRRFPDSADALEYIDD